MSRRVARLVVGGILLLLLSICTYPAADLVGFTIGATQPPTAVGGGGAMPWLHVAHPPSQVAYIADDQGRRVILRGATVGGLIDWWSGSDPGGTHPAPRFPISPSAYDGTCPSNTDLIRVPPVCRIDFQEMARLGFDVVRLGVSWSLLEPVPGRYSREYLDRIAQVVGWAREYGIYVLLDMHQDGYSRYIPRPASGAAGGRPPSLNDHDGAPAWAVDTDGFPSEKFLGERELNPAVDQAFTSFWLNRHVAGDQGSAPGSGLQDHYIGALAALSRRFLSDSTVVGFNVINEPWPGWIAPPLFEDLYLIPFYRRVIDAIAGSHDGLPCPASIPAVAACGYPDLNIHDRRHIFVLEADHLRSQIDFQTDMEPRVTSDPNLVYAIHAYTHKFTLDALFGVPGYPPGGYEQSYSDAQHEARAMRAALFVTEFGNEPQADPTQLANQLLEQERFLVGSTYWPWKENCDIGPTWGVYSGIFGSAADQRCAYDDGRMRAAAVQQNGCLRISKERLLARAYPRTISGRDPSYSYDPSSGRFAFNAIGSSGQGLTTVLYVPAEVTGTLSVTGDAVLTKVQAGSDGSRLANVQPGAGRYQVLIAPAPLHLVGCSG